MACKQDGALRQEEEEEEEEGQRRRRKRERKEQTISTSVKKLFQSKWRRIK
jgi:hypothetical protein